MPLRQFGMFFEPSRRHALVEEDRLIFFKAAPVPPTYGKTRRAEDVQGWDGMGRFMQAIQKRVGRFARLNGA